MIANLVNDDSLTAKKEKQVFNLIRKNKVISRKDLLKECQLKIATLYRTIDSLLEKQLIIANGASEGESKRGRPSALFSINKDINYVIGICIDRNYYKIAVLNLNGEILTEYRGNIDKNTTPQKFINEVYDEYCSICKKIDLNQENIIGIGVGTVGPLNIDDGMILNPYMFSGTGWVNVPIRTMLENKFKKLVVVDNLVRVGVLSEYEHKYIREYKNVAYVTIGIGIGFGLIASGNVIRGNNRIIDGLGHMVVDVDGRRCSCGNFGCVEAYATVLSITNQVVSEIKKGKYSILGSDPSIIDFDLICQAAERGDKLVDDILYDAAYIFSTSLVNFLSIIELEIILLGGELIQKCNRFYEMTKEMVFKNTNNGQNYLNMYKIQNEEDVVLRGSTALLLDYYLP